MDAPFPPLPSAAPRRVLVIGAGMSGLAAAWTLQRAGHDVVIVEARPRLGGRVLTMRDASGSAIAEAGAGRIPASHAWTMQWVERLGLQTERLHPEAGLHPVAYAHGKRIVLSPGEDLAGHFDLTEAEKALGFDALAEAHLNAGVERVRAAGGIDAPGWPPDSLADLDSLNVREHFGRRGLSEAAIDLLLLGPFPQSISPLTVSRLLLSYDRTRVVKLRGGNDRLPQKLAAEIKTPIALGAVVRAIRQNADGLEASLETNGRLEQIFADAAILTVPFSLIGEIAFSPALSPQKQRVIAELGYVAVTKVALKTRSRFWEREGLSGFAQLDTTAEIWSPRRHDQGETGVLQLYQQGEPARAMDAMDPAGRVEFATGVIERVFPGVRAEVEESFEHSWMRDPFARGAYGGRTPGQNFLLRDHGATPEGRLFFAGEHLSLEYPGWIEGALRTGFRAAAEVNGLARP